MIISFQFAHNTARFLRPRQHRSWFWSKNPSASNNMVSIASLSLLLLVTFFSLVSASIPPIQVDLISPRNNTVYLPINPFAFIFAVHNFSSAWKFKPRFEWDLTNINITTGERYYVSDGAVGWNERTPGFGPPPDTFLAVNSSKYLGTHESNQLYYRLDFALFVVEDDCPKSYAGTRNKIFFDTSNITGIRPDFSTLTSCAPPIGALGLDGYSPTNETCIKLASPQPAPIQCTISVDEPTAGRIQKVLDQPYRDTTSCACARSTWPNMTILSTNEFCESCPKISLSNLLQKVSWATFGSALAIAFAWG